VELYDTTSTHMEGASEAGLQVAEHCVDAAELAHVVRMAPLLYYRLIETANLRQSAEAGQAVADALSASGQAACAEIAMAATAAAMGAQGQGGRVRLTCRGQRSEIR
jgi:hypothetical protein